MTMTGAIGGAMLTAAMLAGPSAQNVRWDQIADLPAITVYVDRASVPASGDLRSVTTRTVYKGTLPDGYVAERIRVEEFECAQNRSRIRQVTIVASDGRQPQTMSWAAGESTWSPTEPNSVGQQKQEVACGVAGR